MTDCTNSLISQLAKKTKPPILRYSMSWYPKNDTTLTSRSLSTYVEKKLLLKDIFYQVHIKSNSH